MGSLASPFAKSKDLLSLVSAMQPAVRTWGVAESTSGKKQVPRLRKPFASEWFAPLGMTRGE